MISFHTPKEISSLKILGSDNVTEWDKSSFFIKSRRTSMTNVKASSKLLFASSRVSP